jgi:uncharacterized protein YndB with AHSA1/START domain
MIDAALKAIAEPRRRRILELVGDGELTAGEISAHFEVTRAAISQHLTVLKDAGLISERRAGTHRLYQARGQGFASARLFLERFWDARLGRLKGAAEDLRRRGSGEITERVSVERELLLGASPEAVWELLTDPAEAIRWMGQAAVLDVTPGGEFRIEVVPGEVVTGRFVDVDRPHRLAYTWGWEGSAGTVVPPGSTIVAFELVPNGDGTVLRLMHRDLPSVASAGSHSRGWGHYLDRLATLASGASPGPDPWATDPDRLMSELRPTIETGEDA